MSSGQEQLIILAPELLDASWVTAVSGLAIHQVNNLARHTRQLRTTPQQTPAPTPKRNSTKPAKPRRREKVTTKSASPETTQPTPPAPGSPASARGRAETAGTRSVEVPAAQLTKSAGHIIVDTLVAHGVRRTYVVPGESFLDVLDGLHDSPIDTILCRHEGGATYMGEADGKIKQTPGVAW